ncbi:MAG: phosphatidate cytidylyltransferase [Firmicutes bacterium]|nr:phosphatidate cytidylyltransferase [Bacillota bacterium]
MIFLTHFSQFIFDAVLILFIALSTLEMIKVGKEKEFKVTAIPLILSALAVYPMIYFFSFAGLAMVAGVAFLIIFVYFVFRQDMEFKDFTFNVLILVYPLITLSLAIYLIHQPFYTLFYGERTAGMIPFLIPVASAMCSDTFAFYFGSLIKGPKIFPKISPKKTYAGCIAGIFGGMVGALVVYLVFEYAGAPLYAPFKFGEIFSKGASIGFYIGIGAVISVVSQIGDLGASRIKRTLEIKDFSSMMGSHGGVMDRLDSIIFSLPVMAIIMYFII